MATLAQFLARLDALEAAVGLASEGPLGDERHLPTVEVAARYATSVRTVERWAKDPELGFPKPIYINRRKFWSLKALRSFDRKRVRAGMRLKPEPVHPDHRRKRAEA